MSIKGIAGRAQTDESENYNKPDNITVVILVVVGILI